MKDTFQENPKNGLVPNEQGYKDRKMAKWNGFILSDHTELHKKETAKRNKVNIPKEKQSLTVVSEHLSQAFLKKCSVAIQMDSIANGLYDEDIIGTVSGFDESQIYIQTTNGHVTVDLESIRHVSLLSMVKWFKNHS